MVCSRIFFMFRGITVTNGKRDCAKVLVHRGRQYVVDTGSFHVGCYILILLENCVLPLMHVSQRGIGIVRHINSNAVVCVLLRLAILGRHVRPEPGGGAPVPQRDAGLAIGVFRCQII